MEFELWRFELQSLLYCRYIYMRYSRYQYKQLQRKRRLTVCGLSFLTKIHRLLIHYFHFVQVLYFFFFFVLITLWIPLLFFFVELFLQRSVFVICNVEINFGTDTTWRICLQTLASKFPPPQFLQVRAWEQLSTFICCDI